MKRTAIEAFNETMLIFEEQCREQERYGEEFERNNQSEGADPDLERYCITSWSKMMSPNVVKFTCMQTIFPELCPDP